MYTVYEATYEILRRAKQPLLMDEIIEAILEEKLVESRASEPFRSLKVALQQSIETFKGTNKQLVERVIVTNYDEYHLALLAWKKPLKNMNRKAFMKQLIIEDSVIDSILLHAKENGIDDVNDFINQLLKTGVKHYVSKMDYLRDFDH